MRIKKWIPRILIITSLVFALLNGIAYNHAYRFTHFTLPQQSTRNAWELSNTEKVSALFMGVKIPKPANLDKPSRAFETVTIKSDSTLEAWHIKIPDAKGTVILFHGYAAAKWQLLDRAEEFLGMGYEVLLVDFRGSGGSEGTTTSIGYHEARDVKVCVDFVRKNEKKQLFLFGTSMGAVAIMKALRDEKILVSGVILECPFSTMLKTVENRFRLVGLPQIGLSNLLLFWGGIQNDFPTFSHNPAEYAKHIHVKTLVIYGEKDDRVDREEIDLIYKNLPGIKQLLLMPKTGHDNFLQKEPELWIKAVSEFVAKD